MSTLAHCPPVYTRAQHSSFLHDGHENCGTGTRLLQRQFIGYVMSDNGLAVRPRGSFSANFCPTFITFLEPEHVSSIDLVCPLVNGNNKPTDHFISMHGHKETHGVAQHEITNNNGPLFFPCHTQHFSIILLVLTCLGRKLI